MRLFCHDTEFSFPHDFGTITFFALYCIAQLFYFRGRLGSKEGNALVLGTAVLSSHGK